MSRTYSSMLYEPFTPNTAFGPGPKRHVRGPLVAAHRRQEHRQGSHATAQAQREIHHQRHAAAHRGRRRQLLRKGARREPPLSTRTGSLKYLPPPVQEVSFEYLRLPLKDMNTESVLDFLPKAVEFLQRCGRQLATYLAFALATLA
eukprot:3223374-Prymnesium_polylepis.1